jgi:hypothetical protein
MLPSERCLERPQLKVHGLHRFCSDGADTDRTRFIQSSHYETVARPRDGQHNCWDWQAAHPLSVAAMRNNAQVGGPSQSDSSGEELVITEPMPITPGSPDHG